MKPPKTAALWMKLEKLGWRHDSLPISTIMASHEQLEKELAEAKSDLEFRRELYAVLKERADRLEKELAEAKEQVASRNKRLAKTSEELDQARQDAKQSDLDALRALGERNDARKELSSTRGALMLAAEWGVSSDGFSSEVAGNLRCWIINGMKGPPPKAPDYYPKSNRDENHH